MHLIPKRAHNTTIWLLHGRAYRWSGWFGSQLVSLDWRRAKVGDQRVIRLGVAGEKKYVMVPFRSERAFLRYYNYWTLVSTQSHDDYNLQIHAFRNDLKNVH